MLCPLNGTAMSMVKGVASSDTEEKSLVEIEQEEGQDCRREEDLRSREQSWAAMDGASSCLRFSLWDLDLRGMNWVFEGSILFLVELRQDAKWVQELGSKVLLIWRNGLANLSLSQSQSGYCEAMFLKP